MYPNDILLKLKGYYAEIVGLEDRIADDFGNSDDVHDDLSKTQRAVLELVQTAVAEGWLNLPVEPGSEQLLFSWKHLSDLLRKEHPGSVYRTMDLGRTGGKPVLTCSGDYATATFSISVMDPPTSKPKLHPYSPIQARRDQVRLFVRHAASVVEELMRLVSRWRGPLGKDDFAKEFGCSVRTLERRVEDGAVQRVDAPGAMLYWFRPVDGT